MDDDTATGTSVEEITADTDDKSPGGEDAPAESPAAEVPQTTPAEAGPAADAESSTDSESTTSSPQDDERAATKRLEEEGDVAADYLEELLDILDLDGDIDIDVENGRASVSVGDASSARSLRRLVGTDGEVLEALQELTRLAVQTKTGERTRLMLDVAGHRSGRRRELESLAAETVEQVRRGGEPISLSPMTPFERKVIHDVVADAGLRSESEGEGVDRRVVVHPASA